jgi:hypothetical protein
MLARLLLAQGMEVATAAVLHDEAVELVRLEVGEECGEEGVVEEAEDLALRLRAGHLVAVDDGRLVHHLRREESARAAQLHQVHAPDVAVAQPLQQPEVALLRAPPLVSWLPPAAACSVFPPALVAATAAVAPAA